MADEKTCGVTVPDSGDGRGCELKRNHLFEHMVSMGEGKRALRARDWSAPDEPKRCAARVESELKTYQCDYTASHDGNHCGMSENGGGAATWGPEPGDEDGTVRPLFKSEPRRPTDADNCVQWIRGTQRIPVDDAHEPPVGFRAAGAWQLAGTDGNTVIHWRRIMPLKEERAMVRVTRSPDGKHTGCTGELHSFNGKPFLLWLTLPTGYDRVCSLEGFSFEKTEEPLPNETPMQTLQRKVPASAAPAASAASPDKAGATHEERSRAFGEAASTYAIVASETPGALETILPVLEAHRLRVPSEVPAKDGSQTSADVNISARIDAIKADGGISGAESHVLRDIARNCGEHGRVFGDDKILRLLVEHGFVTAYTPTPLGREVVAQLDNGTLLFY